MGILEFEKGGKREGIGKGHFWRKRRRRSVESQQTQGVGGRRGKGKMWTQKMMWIGRRRDIGSGKGQREKSKNVTPRASNIYYWRTWGAEVFFSFVGETNTGGM